MGLPAWPFKSYSRFAGLKRVGCLTESFKNEFGWLQIICGLDYFCQLSASKTSQVQPTSNLRMVIYECKFNNIYEGVAMFVRNAFLLS